MPEKEPNEESKPAIDPEFWEGMKRKTKEKGSDDFIDRSMRKGRKEEYKKVKKELEDFRKQQGIEKTAEELAAEDADLREKFNID